MDNLPEELSVDDMHQSNRASGANDTVEGPPNIFSLCRWIKDLQLPEKRPNALQLIVTNRGICEDLALLLWTSFGTIAILLQEITAVFPDLSTADLSQKASIRVYNALILLQCVASHQETRKKILMAWIPHYLYPLMNTQGKNKAHEYIRLGSLGVIAAMVKADDPAVTHFLLESEAIPYFLHCIRVGSTQSKTLATFIVHKVLSHDEGLRYCCGLPERVFGIDNVLSTLLNELAVAERASPELLRLVIGCYFRLSGKQRARDGLKHVLPAALLDNTFIKHLQADPIGMDYWRKLLQNLCNRNTI